MLEILVARVEVVPKVIPLIIIHKPVVALARHTRALHGTRVRVFGMDGERQEKEAGRKEARFRSTTLEVSMSMTKKGVVHVNLVALVDWLPVLFIKLHKRQPGERDIPVPAKARPAGAHMSRSGWGWVGAGTHHHQHTEVKRAVAHRSRQGAVGNLMQIPGGPSRRESSISGSIYQLTHV